MGECSIMAPTIQYLEVRERLLLEQLESVAEARAELEYENQIRRDLLKCLPETDEWDDASVLFITKEYINQPGKNFAYVALKKVGLWWLTGTVRVHPGMTYDQLRNFTVFETLTMPQVWEATGWKFVE